MNLKFTLEKNEKKGLCIAHSAAVCFCGAKNDSQDHKL